MIIECSFFVWGHFVITSLSSLASLFLRYYDILEDRVPAGLVAEYQALLSRCSEKFQEFSSLRNGLSSDSDSELDNVSMVEGLRLYEQMETFKRKLRIIENPLLRSYIYLYCSLCTISKWVVMIMPDRHLLWNFFISFLI